MTRRWYLVLALLVAILIATATFLATGDGDDPVFCTADARIGPSGETYGRSAAHDCKFVDDKGNVLPGQ